MTANALTEALSALSPSSSEGLELSNARPVFLGPTVGLDLDSIKSDAGCSGSFAGLFLPFIETSLHRQVGISYGFWQASPNSVDLRFKLITALNCLETFA